MTNRMALDVIEGPNGIADCQLASDSEAQDKNNRVKLPGQTAMWADWYFAISANFEANL